MEEKTNIYLVEKFILSEECQMCGSQRCIPTEEEWREGCPKWRNFKNRNTDDLK